MSDPASIDQQLKRAHQVFREQREEIGDLKRKLASIRDYCDPHLENMWAARIAGIIEDKDFREVRKLKLNE